MSEKVVPIVPSSPQALQMSGKKVRKTTYPWYKLEVGQSFQVSPETMKWTTLEPYVARMSKKVGRNFVAINHGTVFEVARVPDEVIEKKDFGFNNIAEALKKQEREDDK